MSHKVGGSPENQLKEINKETGGMVALEVDRHETTNTSETQEYINVDELLANQVGACGLWQWIVVTLCILSAPSMATVPIFINAVPDLRCQMEPDVEQAFVSHNLSFSQILNIISPEKPYQHDMQRGCSRIKVDWTDATKVSNMIDDYLKFNRTALDNLSQLSMETCPLGYVYQSHQHQYPSTIVADFDLVCTNSWIAPFGTSLFMFGMLVGYILGGWFGDRYGRQPTAIAFSIIELVGGLIISIAPNHYVYHAARTLVGVTNTGKASVLRLLPIELTLAKYRGYFGSFLMLGIVFFQRAFMIGVAYFVWNWRWLHAISMMPGLFCFTFFCLLPESPRWYNSQGRPDKAVEVLEKGMRINQLCCTATHDQPRQLQVNFTQSTRLLSKAKSSGNNRSQHRTFCERFRGGCNSIKSGIPRGELLKNLLIGTVLNAAQLLAFFGLLLYGRVIKDSIYLVAFINATMAIPGPIISSVIYRLFRYRRNPLIICYVITTISLLIGGLYSIIAQPESDFVLNVCCNCALVMYSATTIMMSIYLAELFPSNTRTSSVGVTTGIGRLGSSLSTFVNQLDVQVIHGLPIVIYAGSAIVQTILLLFLRDTTGENLPDVEAQTKPDNENADAKLPEENPTQPIMIHDNFTRV